MKKIVLIALPAIAVLSSCAKNEVYTPQSEPQQITYTTLVGRPSTKAADEIIADNTYPTDETFGTFAFFLKKGNTWAANSDAAQTYIPNSEVSNTSKATSGTAWTTAKAYHWPKQGSFTFFSYSPYDELNAVTTCDKTDGIKIANWDVENKQTVDVMVADYKSEQTKNGTNANYTGVPTVFRHKLAQVVNFTFKTKEDYANGHTEANAEAGDVFFFINSVKINNIPTKATYTSTNKVDGTNLGSWTNPSGDVDYTWYDKGSATTGIAFDKAGKAVAANSLADNRNYLLVMPQQFTDPGADLSTEKSLKISYTYRTYTSATEYTDITVDEDYDEDGNYLTLVPLYTVHGGKATTAWEMNTKYSYTIEIGLDQIYWAPSVETWKDMSWGTYSHAQ